MADFPRRLETVRQYLDGGYTLSGWCRPCSRHMAVDLAVIAATHADTPVSVYDCAVAPVVE